MVEPAGADAPRDILAIGALIVDLVCEVAQLPPSGCGEVVKSYQMSLGGSEANVANVIRQLGAAAGGVALGGGAAAGAASLVGIGTAPGARCTLLAPVGRGLFANFVQGQLRQNGFEPFVVPTDLDNGACVIMVEPNGERTMLTLPGVERAFDPAWFDGLDPQRYSAAMTSGYELDGPGGEPILNFLEANPQILFYYAPGPCIQNVSPSKVARINALSPIWHLNEMEAQAYTAQDDLLAAGERILAECNNAVVITEGAAGAHLFSAQGHALIPSLPVKPVDTIGAGDAHLGALIAARNQGATWEESLNLANRIAAAVCQQKGAQLPDAVVAGLVA